MTRRARPPLPWTPLPWMMLLCLAGSLAADISGAAARADGPALKAVFGIGGRYRPGGWCPVTVTVQNPGPDPADGQIQALSEADPNAGRFGRPQGGAAGAAVFSRPVSVPPGAGAHTFRLYAHGLDPGAGGVTVRLAEGRARGDGRILARASSTPGPDNALPAVVGTPVPDNDLLLVGLAGEPGAFAGLNGRQLGLSHQPGRGAVPAQAQPLPGQPMNPTGNQTPGTAQVAPALPADLPDRPAGYGGVDGVLLRGDAPLDALSQAQADALKQWVAGGGHLVVFCPGTDPGPYAAPFFQGLLPATVTGTAKGTLALAPKPLGGVRAASPDLVSGPYGAGWVSVTTRDPLAAAAPPSFWASALASPPSLLASAAAHDEAADGAYYFQNGGQNGGAALLSSAVLRAPSLDAPGTWAIGLFLLVYLIILVPVNYLILKRLDRRELAWVTIPALVLVFALGTFGVGYAAKGGRVFVNRAAIVETSAGQPLAGVRGAVGLFSPRRTTYDLSLSGAGLSAALPSSASSRFGGGGDSEAQSVGQTRLVQTTDGTALQDTPVNMWAMRAFDYQATTDLGGAIDAQVSGGTLVVTNRTAHALSDCVVLRGGFSSAVGPLAPGQSASVPLGPAPFVNPQMPGLLIPAGRVTDANDAVTPRMRAALADYAQSLARPDNGGNYFSNGRGMAPPRAPFAAGPGEALLLGWSDDPALPGAAPRVDGRPAPGSVISLVIVHLPLPASLAAQAPPPVPPAFRPQRFGIAPPPPGAGLARFPLIPRASPAYQQAQDVRAFVPPGRAGLPFHVRGRISGTSLNGGLCELSLFPVLGGNGPGVKVVLPAQYNIQQNEALALMGREVVVSGVSGPPAPGTNAPSLDTQPSRVRIVMPSQMGSIMPALPPHFPISGQRAFSARIVAPMRFPHVPRFAAPYRRARDVSNFTPPGAGGPYHVRGFVVSTSLSGGQCDFVIQSVTGAGRKLSVVLPAAYGVQGSETSALAGREVIVSGLAAAAPLGGAMPPLSSQPSEVVIVDNTASVPTG